MELRRERWREVSSICLFISSITTWLELWSQELPPGHPRGGRGPRIWASLTGSGLTLSSIMLARRNILKFWEREVLCKIMRNLGVISVSLLEVSHMPWPGRRLLSHLTLGLVGREEVQRDTATLQWNLTLSGKLRGAHLQCLCWKGDPANARRPRLGVCP